MHGLISSVKMVYTIFAVNLSCLLLAVYHGMFTAVTEQFDIVLDERTVTLIFSGLIMHMPLFLYSTACVCVCGVAAFTCYLNVYFHFLAIVRLRQSLQEMNALKTGNLQVLWSNV